MLASRRFQSPSASLTLKSLLKRMQRTLWIGLGLAVALHGASTQLVVSGEEQRVARPLTTQFVKRQPRLAKPLELKRRPQPRRRTVERKMVSVKARMQRDQRGSGFQPMHVLSGLVRPGVRIRRGADFASETIEPRSIAGVIEGAREVEQKIDMSLELLDIGTLNTGRYHAMVVQDPTDRKSIKGFCRLAVAHSARIYPPRYPSFEEYIMPGFLNLAAAMNKYTPVATEVMGRITLGSSELMKAPWICFMAFYGFVLTDVELGNLGRYLLGGGFVFADGHPAPSRWETGYQSLRGALLDALETQGAWAAYEVLPTGHPVYHCYFDFDGGPVGSNATVRGRQAMTDDPVEGLTVGGRLVAILGRNGYYHPWTFWGPAGSSKFPYRDWDPTRQLQFGVNTIIFALTQQGSITHRLMEGIR